MAEALVSESSTMTQAEFVARLNELAEQLTQIGLVDEANRAWDIAREVRALRAEAGAGHADIASGSIRTEH